MSSTPALVGFVAWSGSGKTTLIESLLPRLAGRGLRIAAIKHAHHHFDVDTPGKDSHRLRQAGAARVLVASRRRFALMVETPDNEQPSLAQCLANLGTDELDLVLVEGFKHERYPKIEVHRPSLGRCLMFPEDDSIVAVATDAALSQPTRLPLLDLNDPAAITDYLLSGALLAVLPETARNP